MTQVSSEVPQKPNLWDTNIRQWFLGGAGILVAAAVIYFLGHLYIDAYYGFFGIQTGILSFSIYEYMYYSFPIIMMLIGIIFWVMIMHRQFNKGDYSLISTDKPWKEQTSDCILEFIVFWTCLFLTMYFFVITKYLPITKPLFFGSVAFTALFLGASAIGLLRYFYIFMAWATDPQMTQQRRAITARFRLGFFLVIVIALLPLLTNRVAELSAIDDFENLPHVTIISDTLPFELQSSSNETAPLAMNLLLINNDIAYFFKANSNSNDINYDKMLGKGSVYTIKMPDIKSMIFDK